MRLTLGGMVMPAVAIIGAQWGDEGKGKVVDLLAEQAGVVARYGGGDNAGHTLVVNGDKRVVHLVPSGILRPDALNLVGKGVVCKLPVLAQELSLAQALGTTVYADQSAPVILPIHVIIDQAREQCAGVGKIGTTGRGIGPCYEDLTARRRVTLGDLASEDRIRAALAARNFYNERVGLADMLGAERIPSLDETIAFCFSYRNEICPHLKDTASLLRREIETGTNVLFEGAQGGMLDLMHGSYPYVTSSRCGIAGVNASFGAVLLGKVVGVAKAYATRVGEGPFPTELTGEVGERLRETGGEYGATTGRPRRCGWLDLRALRHVIQFEGITHLVLTKLDVLSGFKEIFVCTDYEGVSQYETLNTENLEQAEPTWIKFDGWETNITDCSTFEDLPNVAQFYITAIEGLLGIPVVAIGTGPDRHDMIFRQPIW